MIYYGNKRDVTDFISENAFYVNSCGITHTDSEYSVVREHGRNDYHILLVTKGSCCIDRDGERLVLRENDMFLYYPHEIQLYSYDDKDNWSYWVHFSGNEVEKVLGELHLSSGLYHLGESATLTALLDKMQKEYATYSVVSDTPNENSRVAVIRNGGYLVEFLCGIYASVNTASVQSVSLSFTEDANRFPAKEFVIDRYARRENLSRSRYNCLFKEETGLSPCQYLIHTRIAKAQWLIKHSNMNISQVAEKVGYADPLYFSRIFKNKTGESPMEYLKKCREQGKE